MAREPPNIEESRRAYDEAMRQWDEARKVGRITPKPKPPESEPVPEPEPTSSVQPGALEEEKQKFLARQPRAPKPSLPKLQYIRGRGPTRIQQRKYQVEQQRYRKKYEKEYTQYSKEFEKWQAEIEPETEILGGAISIDNLPREITQYAPQEQWKKLSDGTYKFAGGTVIIRKEGDFVYYVYNIPTIFETAFRNEPDFVRAKITGEWVKQLEIKYNKQTDRIDEITKALESPELTTIQLENYTRELKNLRVPTTVINMIREHYEARIRQPSAFTTTPVPIGIDTATGRAISNVIQEIEKTRGMKEILKLLKKYRIEPSSLMGRRFIAKYNESLKLARESTRYKELMREMNEIITVEALNKWKQRQINKGKTFVTYKGKIYAMTFKERKEFDKAIELKEQFGEQLKYHEWSQLEEEEIMKKQREQADADATTIIEEADKGDLWKKFEEFIYTFVSPDWGIVNKIQDIVTSNDTKKNRIKRVADALYEQREAKRTGGLAGVLANIQSWPVTQVGEAVIGGITIGYGLGYLKSISPVVGAGVAKGVGLGITTYTAAKLIEEAPETIKKGPEKYVPYFAQLGVTGLAGYLGFRGAYKAGSIAGYRKHILSLAVDTAEKARLESLFKAIDASTNMKTGTRKVVALENIKNLSPENQAKLLRFLKSSDAKKFKIVQGGSSSQETYMLNDRAPHDIDMLIKMKKFPKTIAKLKGELKYSPEKLLKHTPEEIKFIEVIVKYGLDPSLFDIHVLPKPGTPFTQLGTGYTQKPIRTLKGSPFKYQMRIQEQLGRKWASALAPTHEHRGKDWLDALRVSAEKWKATPQNKALYKELKLYTPSMTITRAGYKLTGLSYYEKYPSLAPRTEFTRFERLIRKRVTPIKTFESGAGFTISTEGAKWGPKIAKFGTYNPLSYIPTSPEVLGPITGVAVGLALTKKYETRPKKQPRTYYVPPIIPRYTEEIDEELYETPPMPYTPYAPMPSQYTPYKPKPPKPTPYTPIPPVATKSPAEILIMPKKEKEKKKKKKKPKPVTEEIMRARKQEAYHTYVNNRKVTREPTIERHAVGIGAYITDRTKPTSFKVKKVIARPRPRPAYDYTWATIGHKFTKKENVYHEKKQYQKDYDIERRKYVQKPQKRASGTKTNFFSITTPMGVKR